MSAIAAPATAATPTRQAESHTRGGVEPLNRPEAHYRADEHHPLHSEVEDSRALGEELAEGREQERRSVEDGGGEDHDHEALVQPGREELARHDAASAEGVSWRIRLEPRPKRTR